MRTTMASDSPLLGSATDVGRRRDHNEDALITFETPRGWTVCIVADGMGGHLAGEVASARAVEVLERELRAATAEPNEALRSSIEIANRAIWDEAESDPTKAGMGCTVVAAILAEGRVFLAN